MNNLGSVDVTFLFQSPETARAMSEEAQYGRVQGQELFCRYSVPAGTRADDFGLDQVRGSYRLVQYSDRVTVCDARGRTVCLKDRTRKTPYVITEGTP